MDTIDIMATEEVYKELFIDKEYIWKPYESVETIIDLGAHFGDTSLYYQLLYPEAKIVAVEPSSENIMRIKKATINYPKITTVTAAAGIKDGEADFHITPSTLGSSLVKRAKSKTSIKVPVMTLDTIFKTAKCTAPVDLIKFDIEGSEFELFSGINPAEYSKAYIGEIHLDFVEGSSVDKFLDSFYGFDCSVIPVEGHEEKRFMFQAVCKKDNIV